MMPFPQNTIPRIWTLSNANCDGTITEQELQELQSLLEADPDAKQFYADFLNISAEISWMISAKQHSALDLGPRSADYSISPNRAPILDFLGDWAKFFSQHSPMSYVFLFMILCATLVGITYLSTRVGNVVKSPAEPLIAAQITREQDCQWLATSPAPVAEEPLRVGQQLRLDKGIVQFTYSNGATVLLQGPADYTLGSLNSGYLKFGKLTARCGTEQSRQFTIVTPNARFIDLGTEFGVMVNDKGHSEVAVFSGKVNAASKLPNDRWDTPVVVSEGKAVACEGGKIASVVAQRSSFPSLQPLPPPAPLPDPSYQRWLDASRELQKHPDLLAYYDFEPDQGELNVLKNRASTGAALNGEILDTPWVEGRFPGKGALDFAADGAGARINLPGDQRQLTLIAWLLGNDLANDNNGILMSDNWKQSKQLHWEILKSGQVHLCIFGQWEPNVSARALPADCLKQCCMLAAVIDTNANLHRLYLNGELFDEIKSGGSMPPANIGSATIGGWNNQGKGDSPQGNAHNLSGRMDELMIFQKALSAEEIKQLYEAGKP